MTKRYHFISRFNAHTNYITPVVSLNSSGKILIKFAEYVQTVRGLLNFLKKNFKRYLQLAYFFAFNLVTQVKIFFTFWYIFQSPRMQGNLMIGVKNPMQAVAYPKFFGGRSFSAGGLGEALEISNAT